MVMNDNKDISLGLLKVKSIVGAMKLCTNYRYMLILEKFEVLIL